MRGFLIALLASVMGIALAAAVPEVPQALRRTVGLSTPLAPTPAAAPTPATPKAGGPGQAGTQEGRIAMTAEQVTAAGIEVVPVSDGGLVSRVSVPGVLAASQDRLARVTARVGGRVAEVRKGLGEQVAKGDVLAVIESREVADAKGEFLAATRKAALAETILAREARLWKQRISAEQDFLQARTSAEEARIRVDLARQKLSALGLSDAEVAGLPRQSVAALSRLELRAPLTGQVTARAAVLGAAVSPEAELFSVADLSTLWVEMAIPPRDLPIVRQGQSVTVSGEGDAKGEGRVVFFSPLLDLETRSARAVAELGNQDGRWRPGGFASVSFAAVERKVAVLVPRAAVQEVEGKKVVFVRTAEGFDRREVALGGESDAAVEVVSGLAPGAEIAVANTFSLKAELGKAQAED